MCGIAGVLSLGNREPLARLPEALALLAHRGPDGEGLWRSPEHETPRVALGHRRLAVIDLSPEAAQPMVSGEGRHVLTYNGEIYNYRELGEHLAARGHSLRTRSDTEVLLAAYAEWGPACLERLNGMFAFALWDAPRRELVAARDRFGEKPFYYSWDDSQGVFVFASEVKAVLRLLGRDPGLEEATLHRYASARPVAAGQATLWREVRRLPHAHALRLRFGSRAAELRLERYWTLEPSRREEVPEAEAARRLADLLADSVRLRLRADVAVGTSLSGGLDSSSIVHQVHALGAAAGQKAFSARMEDPALDEGRYVAAALSGTGIAGHEVWPKAADLERHFGRLCAHQEEPFSTTSPLAQYLVMALAREHGVTVLLDGQGADELLGGYRPYVRLWYVHLARAGKLGALLAERRAFRAVHAGPFPLDLPAAAAAWLAGRGLRREPTGHRGHPGSFWREEWLRSFPEEHSAPGPGPDGLTDRLRDDAVGGPLQELLRYADRNSMAWSREVRLPFLDYRLAEWAIALPPERKIRGGRTKVVLRDAMRGLVPAEILARTDKLGFQAPTLAWLRGPLANWTVPRLEEAARELGERLVPDLLDRHRQRGIAQEAEARALVGLLSLAEGVRQVRACASPGATLSVPGGLS